MPLAAGTRLGVFEILAPLGKGGMGEVYRARDAKLGREVAVKILPEEMAERPERIARFDREARSLAALNHPGIAAIYGIEETQGTRFLVLELVEGETLAERLRRGPLPVDEALKLCAQIAEALESAHGKGVLHRDLKPANLMVTPGGQVKVLDFGLAKALFPDSVEEASRPSTITTEETVPGTILGTTAYMSPEQARGMSVDRQTDIWAFGCCLYEALTGHAPFRRGTTSDTIAAILERDPDWDALPPSTPLRVRELIRRCLEKDPKRRLHDVADARLELEDSLVEAPPVGRMARLALPSWVVTALLLLALGVVATQLLRREPSLPRLANPAALTAAIGLEDYPTCSPDGQTVAYESNQAGGWDIWVSQLGGGGAANRTMDHQGADRYPSWSPDGRQIAFWSARDGGGYFVMPAVGGVATKVAATPGTNDLDHSPPEWSTDGTELAYVKYEVGSTLRHLLEIVSLVTRETRQRALPGTQGARIDLSWSHDGRFIAYVDLGQQNAETSQLFVLRLADGVSVPATDARANVRSPRWALDGTSLYFVANLVGPPDLWRQAMNTDGEPVGEPQQVTTGLEVRHASFSPDGLRVAYSKGRWVSNVWRVPILEERPATWDDAEQVTFDRAFIEFVDVSPDGRSIAFSSDRTGNQDLWTMPLAGGEPVRLTSDPAPEWAPRWSPDGKQIEFYSYRTGDRELWVMSAEGGPARRLTHSDGLDAAGDWSPDGREFAFRSERRGSSDIWVLPVEGGDARLLTPDPASDYGGTWSPDGTWVAYVSNRSGALRIWRVPAQGGEPERLTDGPGWLPLWSPDGARIFFAGADERSGNLWSVSLADSTERPLTSFIGRRGTLNTQAPDAHGGYLYFTWRDDVGDIWVMDVIDDTNPGGPAEM